MVCGFQLQFWGTKTRKGWGKAVPSYQLWLAGVWGGVAWLETGLRQQHSDITQFPGHPVISIVSCIFLSSMALHTTSTSLPQGDHCFVVGLALQFLQEEPPSGSLTTRTWISSRWAPPCFVGCPRILCGGAVAAAPGAAPDLFLFVISSRSIATCHPHIYPPVLSSPICSWLLLSHDVQLYSYHLFSVYYVPGTMLSSSYFNFTAEETEARQDQWLDLWENQSLAGAAPYTSLYWLGLFFGDLYSKPPRELLCQWADLGGSLMSRGSTFPLLPKNQAVLGLLTGRHKSCESSGQGCYKLGRNIEEASLSGIRFPTDLCSNVYARWTSLVWHPCKWVTQV